MTDSVGRKCGQHAVAGMGGSDFTDKKADRKAGISSFPVCFMTVGTPCVQVGHPFCGGDGLFDGRDTQFVGHLLVSIPYSDKSNDIAGLTCSVRLARGRSKA